MVRPFQSSRGLLAPSSSFSPDPHRHHDVAGDDLMTKPGTLATATATMAAMMTEIAPSILGLVLFLLLLFILACRPWRFLPAFSSSSASSRLAADIPAAEVDDLASPLFSENSVPESCPSYALDRKYIEESRIHIDTSISKSGMHGLVSKKRVQSSDCTFSGDNLVLDVTSDVSEDLQVSQTLKLSEISSWPSGDKKHLLKDFTNDIEVIIDNGRSPTSPFNDKAILRSSLTLEVISGPSRGLHCSRQSANNSVQLTIGRVSPCDLVLKDSEVSGKHAVIKWNMKNSKWELVDMGSMNGTFLNSHVVSHHNYGSRQWSEPFELGDADVITLGSSSKVAVKISNAIQNQLPLGVGMVSDPMAKRQGGEKLPMEDICFCQWPLFGIEQFGLFGIFDGHGGVGAAKAASKILPDKVANILSHPERKERVFSICEASDVLQDAFTWTEAAINHQCEGCTATVLLTWIDHNKDVYAQCANVGDSSCIISVDGKLIAMTEDHRVINQSERTRFARDGKPLKEGESRLHGINISRMLGDKFLKEQDDRFSSEPYISQVVPIGKSRTAFALMASDGLWDVISPKKAVQLVLQLKKKYCSDGENSGEMIASSILNEARTLKTKDNTSVIFLDFDALRIV